MTLREILQIESSPFSREFLHVIEVADRLHPFPASRPIPVVLTRSRSEDGAYHSLERPSRSVKIGISIFAPHPGLTLLHEVGHFLDHQALNPMRRGFGSEIDPIFENLWALWRKSRLVRHLTALRERKRPPASVTARRFLNYQLLPIELWARTYVQWIVTRSDDLMLQSQLQVALHQNLLAGGNLADYYWDAKDFERIIPAVNDLFRQAELL